MWNGTLEKTKIVLVFMLPILKKKVFTGVYAVETINTEDTLTSG